MLRNSRLRGQLFAAEARRAMVHSERSVTHPRTYQEDTPRRERLP